MMFLLDFFFVTAVNCLEMQIAIFCPSEYFHRSVRIHCLSTAKECNSESFVVKLSVSAFLDGAPLVFLCSISECSVSSHWAAFVLPSCWFLIFSYCVWLSRFTVLLCASYRSNESPKAEILFNVMHLHSCALFEFGIMNKMCLKLRNVIYWKWRLKITQNNKHYIQKENSMKMNIKMIVQIQRWGELMFRQNMNCSITQSRMLYRFVHSDIRATMR